MIEDGAPLVQVPENPMPDGGKAAWLIADDGARLRVARWQPAGAVRGTVVLLHGRTEYIEKYFEVIGELLERGFAVTTMDWRGQGLSQRETDNPLRGHVGDFARLEADLGQFMREFVQPDCPQPWLVMVHSMGGNVVMRWLHDAAVGSVVTAGVPPFAGAVFSAPMLGLTMKPAVRAGLTALAKALKTAGLGKRYVPGASDASTPGNEKFEDTYVTSDPRRHARQVAILKAEPAMELAAPTVGFADAMFKTLALVQSPGYVEAISTPALVAGAGRDALVSTPVIRELASRLPNGRYLDFADSLHEILMERDEIRARFWQAFDGFADEVVPRA